LPAAFVAADGAPVELMGKSLLALTEGALSRLRLLQASSLPDQVHNQALGGHRTEMNVEVPFMFGSEQSMVHLQIFEDGKGTEDGDQREWKMRIAVNRDIIGEVGAEV